MSVDRLVEPSTTIPLKAADPDPGLPEKFEGKSAAEIAAAYEELQSTMGKQAQELGQLRQTVANLSAPPAAPAPASKAEDPVDFFDNPDVAIERAVQRNLEPVLQRLHEREQFEVESKLDRDHPNWKATVADQEFQQWVADKPERIERFERANRLHYSSADGLLSDWKALQAARDTSGEEREEAVEQDRKLRAATTEKGTASRVRGKVLSRAQIRHLRMTNPAEYNARMPEIMAAYREGRVTE